MSEPIRVLLLFTVMNRGGAETMIMNYYRHIDRTKVQFDFMVHRQERGAFDDEIEALGGKIYRMIPIYPQNFLKYKRMLKDFFDKHQEYQIIHSHMSELGYFAFQEAARHQIPCRICHAHNAPDFSREGALEWFKLLPRLYFIHNIRRHTTHFFVCSHIAGLWLYGKKYSNQFVFMKNAIQADRFIYHTEEAIKLKKEWDLENKLVICHIGRFNAQKNHSFLIDIFKEIHQKEPSSVLLLVGDGLLKNDIEKKVKKYHLEDSIRFLGQRNDVPQILKASDFLVFPSIYEGLSVVLVEAQSSGIQCFFTETLAKETVIQPQNVELHSLNESAEDWANAVLSKKNYIRKDVSLEIKEKGWDIPTSAKWLENYYINLYHSINERK